MGLRLPHPRALGRFGGPAGLILDALAAGPRTLVDLFDVVRALDGPVGHGTLVASLARLERLRLVEAVNGHGRPAYRLAGEVMHG